jgi:hypothetical protein
MLILPETAEFARYSFIPRLGHTCCNHFDGFTLPNHGDARYQRLQDSADFNVLFQSWTMRREAVRWFQNSGTFEEFTLKH